MDIAVHPRAILRVDIVGLKDWNDSIVVHGIPFSSLGTPWLNQRSSS
jgi:hypothetical protein